MQLSEYKKFTEISIIFAFSTYLITPILSPYIKSLGLSNFQLSLIFSLFPLSIIVFSPIFGGLSDVVGRKKIIKFGIIIEIIALLLYVHDQSWVFIAVARVLDAFAATTVSLVTLSKVEDSLDNKGRGKYTGNYLSLIYAGRLFAPLIGAVVADMFFIKAPFFISIIILVGLFISLFREKDHKKYKVSIGLFNPLTEIKEFLSYKKLRGMGILGMVMHAPGPAINVFLPLLIVEKMGLSISFVGYAFFFLSISHILQFEFGKIADKFSAWKMVLFGCLIYSLGFIFLSFPNNNFIILILILFFMGTGTAMWNVSAWDFMSKVGEGVKKEGMVTTTYLSIAKIGAFFSFVFSGLIVTFFNTNILFLINGLIILVGISSSYFFLKD